MPSIVASRAAEPPGLPLQALTSIVPTPSQIIATAWIGLASEQLKPVEGGGSTRQVFSTVRSQTETSQTSSSVCSGKVDPVSCSVQMALTVLSVSSVRPLAVSSRIAVAPTGRSMPSSTKPTSGSCRSQTRSTSPVLVSVIVTAFSPFAS